MKTKTKHALNALYLIVLVVVVISTLSGCATTKQLVGLEWTPKVQNPRPNYEADKEVCRTLAVKIARDRGEGRLENIALGAALGAVTGGIVASHPFANTTAGVLGGAVAGGAGGGLLVDPSPNETTYRDCLKRRGHEIAN